MFHLQLPPQQSSMLCQLLSQDFLHPPILMYKLQPLLLPPASFDIIHPDSLPCNVMLLNLRANLKEGKDQRNSNVHLFLISFKFRSIYFILTENLCLFKGYFLCYRIIVYKFILLWLSVSTR